MWEFSYDASINVNAMKAEQNQFAFIRADQCNPRLSAVWVFPKDQCYQR